MPRVVYIPENMVRDFSLSLSTNVSTVRDVVQLGRAIGLDFFIRNRGAAGLTVSRDGQPAITVDAGDVYRFNDVRYGRINIVATDTFDAEWFGVLIDTLKVRGLA
jgi:hypothetical protein